MNNVLSDERLIDESTTRDLMVCKINFRLTCSEFYDKIKTKFFFQKFTQAKQET